VDFKALLDAVRTKADADPAARQQAVRDALSAAEDTPNLAELEHAAAGAFADLSADDAVLDENVFAEMGFIADVVDGLRAEATDQQTQRVADLAARVGTPSITTQRPTPPPQPEPAPTEPAPTEPAPTEPADAPKVDDKQLVVASGKAPAKPTVRIKNAVPLATLPVQLPGSTYEGTPFAITAAADLPGINLGSDLTDIDGLTKAVMARFGQLARGGGDVGGSRAGIASITIERDERLIANTQHDWNVIEYACDESRLPGGSLLAAADPVPGWCALGEISYEFCPPAVVDGLIDLPTVTARRGSLTYPQSPAFHEIYSGTGWAYTPAQIDNMQLPVHPTWDGTGTEPAGGPWYNPTVGPVEKDCYKISCPPNADLVLQPTGICLSASILHERAYPELIKYTVAQALAAHAHKMNSRIISQMEGLAQAVNLKTNTNLGPGATAVVLEAIEMQVEWLRYRHRLGVNTTMEMVAPVWMRGILRADLSKRTGVDLLEVNDAVLNRYLASRGVRVQWVLDWQDSFSDPTPAATIPQSDLFGGDGSRAAWPLTGKVLIYPAGTFFLARMDIINLEGGLLDSALLRRNERLVLFSEEAMAVGTRGCFQASALEFNLCPSGQTGSTKAIACAATAGA